MTPHRRWYERLDYVDSYNNGWRHGFWFGLVVSFFIGVLLYVFLH